MIFALFGWKRAFFNQKRAIGMLTPEYWRWVWAITLLDKWLEWLNDSFWRKREEREPKNIKSLKWPSTSRLLKLAEAFGLLATVTSEESGLHSLVRELLFTSSKAQNESDGVQLERA